MASQSNNYGSQPTPPEDFKSSTSQEYSAEHCDESQLISFVSPESPDVVFENTNNITGEPLGELQLSRSGLYKRRKFAKSNNSSELQSNEQLHDRVERGPSTTIVSGKRVRSSACEVDKKSKKIKVDNKDDTTNEGSNGFAHINEFLSQIQHLNDGNLNFELDVSFDSFKLKVDYSFE